MQESAGCGGSSGRRCRLCFAQSDGRLHIAQADDRVLPGLADEPLPGWSVSALRAADQVVSGKVREFVTKYGLQQGLVLLEFGGQGDAAALEVGSAPGAAQPRREPD